MHTTVSSWLAKSTAELDDIYRGASAGSVPVGDTSGTAIVAPGSFAARAVATLARWFAWKGKVFDIFVPPDTGILINKITPLGAKFIVAKVYKGPSWMDGKETIIIDYSTTSLAARKVRDEIREVEPGVFLGKVWWGKRRLIDFALVAPGRAQG